MQQSSRDNVKQFLFGFDSCFGPSFFRAHYNFIAGVPQGTPWQGYYAGTSLNEMQYKFLGINAHINGDMWLDKSIGHHVILSWRKQQVKLAILYYSDPKKWRRKLKRAQCRMPAGTGLPLNG